MENSIQLSTDLVSFGYNISCTPSSTYDLHCHNYYEIYFFLEGNVSYLVEGQKYTPTPGSILLLAPHVFHGVKINDASIYRRYSLHFHPDVLSLERRSFLLSAFFSSEKSTGQQIYFTDLERLHLSVYFEALTACAQQEEKRREQALPICIEALLSQIVSLCSASVFSPHDLRADTIAEIIGYLNSHLKEDLTLDALAERFFISKYHLNKVFRKATGTTVFDYLLRKRIITAQQLLINGASAQDAAAASGFADYSAFYRSYTRILGHSPLQDKGVLPAFSSGEHRQKAVTLRRET